MKRAIHMKNLTTSYEISGDIENISITVHPGEFFGFLDSNGQKRSLQLDFS